MVYDTLTYNGIEKSFSDWGFTPDIKAVKKNQAPDELTLTLGNTNIVAEAANPTFPFEAVVTIKVNRTFSGGVYTGGTTRFQGKRVGQPCRANNREHAVTYKFQGPFYDLTLTPLQQSFVGAGGLTYLIPEIILFTSTAVAQGQIYISVGDQIQAIFQWLLDQYAAQGMTAPFQYTGRALNSGKIDLNSTAGTYNYAVNPNNTTISYALYSLHYPTLITKPIMCSDALKKCLELSPRANVWFDYTTTPPTAHVSLPADQTPKTLPLFDGASHESITITRRDDLFVRAVNLLYRITATINGKPQVDYVQDKWGPHGSNSATDPSTGLRVVTDILDLQGPAITNATAHLDVEPIEAWSSFAGTTPGTLADQAAKRTWWALKRGGEFSTLDDARVRFQDRNGAQTYIADATITNAATNQPMADADLIAAGLVDASGNLVLNRLVRGTQHAWMTRPSDGQPVVSLKVRLLATMTYAEYDCISTATNPDTDITTGIPLKKANTEDHHFNLEVTNGTSGTYSIISSTTEGEAYIIGLGGIAQYLYNHLNAYQYDGEPVWVAAEFADPTSPTYVDLGCTLNLSNGAPEWASMNAQIQSITEDYFYHRTSVQIGVAKHLTAGQFNSILNMWYNRRPWLNPALRTDNTQGSSSDNVDLAVTSGNGNSLPGLVNNGQTGNVDYVTPPSGSTPGTYGGLINNDPKLITTALAATSPTPTAGFNATDIKTIQPREVCLVDTNGNPAWALAQIGGLYTK